MDFCTKDAQEIGRHFYPSFLFILYSLNIIYYIIVEYKHDLIDKLNYKLMNVWNEIRRKVDKTNESWIQGLEG